MARDLRVEICPVGIVFLDQRYLPGARPFLESLLALDRILDLIEGFEINQPGHLMLLGETLGDLQLMLCNAADEVIGHTDVKRATDAAGENVDVIAACTHQPPLGYWVARSSRAMTA
jgi:hypothetical protein